MKAIRKVLFASALASAALGAGQAGAITFVLTDTGGTAVGTNARKGFEIAAAYWSSVLTNDATVNLRIGYSTLGTGILGSTGSTTAAVYNTAVYSALAANVTSTVDASAVASLRPLTPGSGSTAGTGALTFVANALNASNNGYVDTATRVDNDGSANNRGLAVNTSVAKALGITRNYLNQTINYGASDGSITFSNAFSFDFDPSDGIDANSFDFIGVAIHEIGHALGFRSGVDTYDAYTAPGAANTNAGGLENFINIGTSLDLFRYSAPGTLDWSTSDAVKYFSIDGGATQLYGDSRFALGAANGDGRQASHFKDSPAMQPQLGVMDPTSGYGQMQEVTALDIAAFDAIGWRTAFDANTNQGYRMTTASIYNQFASGVPEPATWAMMIAGFGFVGASMRRRSTATTATA